MKHESSGLAEDLLVADGHCEREIHFRDVAAASPKQQQLDSGSDKKA